MVDRTVDFLSYAPDDSRRPELNVSSNSGGGSVSSSTYYNSKLPKTPFLIKAVDLVSFNNNNHH
jgi:hypothetical protein